MLFANMSMEEMKAAESQYLLCLVLLNIDLFNALQLVIIALMRLLKCGYNMYFKAKKTTCHCYRSVYCILGDHPSQALCAGMYFGALISWEIMVTFVSHCRAGTGWLGVLLLLP